MSDSSAPRTPGRRRRATARPAAKAGAGARGAKARSAPGSDPGSAPESGPDSASAVGAGQGARREALRLILGVVEQRRMLSELIERAPADLPPEERARAGALAAATLRHLGQADALIRRFARRRPPAQALAALRLAAVELHALGAPAHAAVDGAVAALRALRGAERFSGLVNAVARRMAAEGGPIWASLDAARTNTPGWLWGRLSSAYGAGAARRMAEAHLRAAPLDLTPRDGARAEALARALDARLLPCGTLRLARRAQISALPGFAEGEWWVQDAAAALPARILAPQAGERVLDMCAAPGGKTMQMAAAGAKVTALDASAARLERLAQNLARTGLSARVVAADALEWTPDAPFDAILLDAPCSATGTIRRHPDLPRLLPEGPDLPALTAMQDALLDRAWGWLRPGGRLVFATCSLLPEEGERRAAAFRARTPDAAPLEWSPRALGGPDFWRDAAGDLRVRPDWSPEAGPDADPRADPDRAPGEHGGMDGFFAAGFVKRA
ncbi:RsmB/NOP family class I SAM-dependent RNA methyltransferase [Oceanicella actignis]|uniref:RsmB/NOP family class I SAM-dependent RNA methyltransferase n=1 Tax=Oceanicella actignis TaxID=1189325 RepID=UPI001255D743|nr:transcription antitermination factor NusB [Oceanicella actignis]TYO88197.1 16S rRNA (cytosine967-C5)-methyltransferase [Oceanicella actignis]